jgi:hypothetical protein
MNGMWTPSDDGLSAFRRYLAVIALGNLTWEFAHMPLYTLWRTGTAGDIVFAAVHCTGGDMLIATVSLVLALLISGCPAWPRERFWSVAATAVILGLGYTVFSEWLNIEIRRSWAYSDLMPTVPWLGVGLTPLAQWLVIPGLGFWHIRRSVLRPGNSAGLRA